jgi:DNA-binding NarL/FixJ family response regulator
MTGHAIAVVEDDPLVFAHLSEILAAAPGLRLAGHAATAAAARDLVGCGADLFLMDIGLPDGNGLDIVPEIKRATTARVLMLTSFGDRETVIAALEAGADGYLLKDSDTRTLLDGIEVTLQGGAPISPAAAVFLLERLRPPVAEAQPTPAEERLTEREIDLLRCFAKGASYKQAARELDISPLTVGTHVKAIYRKLAVHSRGQAVWRASRDHGIDLS